jgi:uncharacterized protein
MGKTVQAVSSRSVKLLNSIFTNRADLNRKYLMSLGTTALLQNFYTEANITPMHTAGDMDFAYEPQHLGWESPLCQLRGHFLGHWLSAAAMYYANTGDTEVKGKADYIISELKRCQVANGGEWIGSIPIKYLDKIAEGQQVWAPQYTLHKTLMGLYDMYAYAENKQALEILENWANWFYNWSGQFSEEKFADILDVETGGIMEVWANLYGITGKEEHLELMKRYSRERLFQPILDGKDVLTNMHANTTIPEVHGAARAYEVTGDERWKKIVESYWKSAVDDRGMFCTGGQTSGEIWTPPYHFSTRLGDKNQEHCTVYNMIRLAEYLFRWTGDSTYMDYIERNIYNGILAQQHPKTGMVTYFIPFQPGSKKHWGSETKHFWCCHGTLAQAHTRYADYIYYEDNDGVITSQFIPSRWEKKTDSGQLSITQTFEPQTMWGIRDPLRDKTDRPMSICLNFEVEDNRNQEFSFKIRKPWWLASDPTIKLNGEILNEFEVNDQYITIRRIWSKDHLQVDLPKQLTCSPLPDRPDVVAFLDGPVVLAGLCDEERQLVLDSNKPESILIPDDEREWAFWKKGYRAKNQEFGLRFIPLYEIADESYTIYFPIKNNANKINSV